MISALALLVLSQTIKLKDEGLPTGSPAGQLNCVGSGISCTGPSTQGGVGTITVTSGTSGDAGSSVVGIGYIHSYDDGGVNALTFDAGGPLFVPDGGIYGSVTSASVVTANGISGTVATATTTPAITLSLAAITPTTVTATGAGGFVDTLDSYATTYWDHAGLGANLIGTGLEATAPNAVRVGPNVTYANITSCLLEVGMNYGGVFARKACVRPAGGLELAGALSATNVSGTNTGDQTVFTLGVTGTADVTKYLRGDGTWSSLSATDAAPPGVVFGPKLPAMPAPLRQSSALFPPCNAVRHTRCNVTPIGVIQ